VHAGRPDYRLEVHLRTLSTNEPHPKALIPILSTALFDTELYIMQKEISGTTLGLLSENSPETCTVLEIWNWVESPHKSVRFLPLFNSGFTKMSNNLPPISI
jgi:hypothetical protein